MIFGDRGGCVLVGLFRFCLELYGFREFGWIGVLIRGFGF